MSMKSEALAEMLLSRPAWTNYVKWSLASAWWPLREKEGEIQLADIPVQEENLYGKLRGHKRIVGANQVGKFPPAKRKSALIEQAAERDCGERPGPARNLVESFEPGERIVPPEQLIPALAGQRDFESGLGAQFGDPIGIQTVDGRLVESPDGVVEVEGFHAARLEGHNLERDAEGASAVRPGQLTFVEFGLADLDGHRREILRSGGTCQRAKASRIRAAT